MMISKIQEHVQSHLTVISTAGSSVAALSCGRVRVKVVQAAAAGGAGVRRAPAGSRSQSAAPAGQHAATPTDSRWMRESRTPQRPRLLCTSLLTCWFSPPPPHPPGADGWASCRIRPGRAADGVCVFVCVFVCVWATVQHVASELMMPPSAPCRAPDTWADGRSLNAFLTLLMPVRAENRDLRKTRMCIFSRCF